ncbi:uncharacterized protein LOC112524246 [Cynara cardunculus var. scolymus]|uniref:uncharacterized protein LOC112524246 n=1 Tax=Cynara cardunculus var. scolymus TaxID=59895 RepID=UPI000D627090|nr:uncharacterized protein LOC112524246 [Cynara cardunculus var. scolymus]
MGLVSVFIRTHFLAFNGFQSDIQDPSPDTAMIPRRRRLLFTVGALILCVLRNILTRMNVSTSPKGKRGKIMCAIEHQWLAILSFFDDHIMVFEDLIEKFFPPSTRVFDKIDELLQVSESLPPKFDDFIDNDVPMIMQHIPFLDRVFKKDEKEIVIDITCHGYRVEPENASKHENVVKSDGENKKVDKEDVDTSKMVDKLGQTNVHEKMTNEEKNHDLNKENDEMDDGNNDFLYSARATSSNEEIVQSEDPIFELFEAGWAMSPRTLSSASSI